MGGKQVQLFLVAGTVGALMTAEILNWTGHVLRGRRKDLGQIKNREFFSAAPGLPTPAQDEDGSTTPNSPVFYTTARRGCKSRAQIIDGEFTVLQGSIIHAQMTKKPNISTTTEKQFNLRKVQHAKVLEVSEPGPKSELATLMKDVVFPSPSSAAFVVASNGKPNRDRLSMNGKKAKPQKCSGHLVSQPNSCQ